MFRCPAHEVSYATAIGERTRCLTCGRTWLLTVNAKGSTLYLLVDQGRASAHRVTA